MRIQLLLYVQLLLAAMLMWTCFCRSVKTDRTTHREVRLAIVFEGVAAGLVLGAPLMPVVMPPGGNHWTPSWPAFSTPSAVWLVLLFAVTMVQLVTAKYWQEGRAPLAFQQSTAVRTGGLVFAAMLLGVGLTSFAPSSEAQTQGQEGEGWARAGAITPLEPGTQFYCGNPGGCIAFNTEALREVLKKAGGTCGRIPPLQKPRGSEI